LDGPPLALSSLAVDGKALMAHAGFKPGREIGRALEMLLDLVIEDPALNTREQLLERARALGPRLRAE
jgi:tRNA nucleotidyltransferase (CCA-adding enzyme)